MTSQNDPDPDTGDDGMTDSSDRAIAPEELARKLWEQGKIVDDRNGERVRLRKGPHGGQYVPHCAVAKYALKEPLDFPV